MKRILKLVVVLVIAGACSAGCSAAGSFSTTSDSSGFGTTPSTVAQDSGGPCNGNPCIGDWEKEAAEGGTVVQCVDGTWSHAGGLSGACSDHGGETSGAPTSDATAATTGQATTDSAGGGGPCDGNPCIGDWQREAAEGGTVVECADGSWSHAGGISGACSDHGGEGDGSAPSTASAATSSAATASPASNGAQDLPVQCGQGVAGSSGMTCTFAENAFYEYWKASGGDPTSGQDVSVWSAEAGQSYPLSCAVSGSVVDCTGTNDSGVALDARLTQSALSAYTSSQAAAYAASGKLGPGASQSTQSGSQFTPGDQNPNDASASKCQSTMEVGPHSDCFVAQKVAADLGPGRLVCPRIRHRDRRQRHDHLQLLTDRAGRHTVGAGRNLSLRRDGRL